MKTFKIKDISCGTADGIMSNFGQIEVEHMLTKDLALDTVRNHTVEYETKWI